MRVLHICQFLGIGGLEQVLFLLIKQQLKDGLSVDVLVYDSDRRWVEKFQSLNINIISDYQKKAGLDFKLLKHLQKNITNYTIVHTHDLNPAIYLSLIKIRQFFTFQNVKFIHTTHGMEHIKESPKTRIYEALIALMSFRIIAVSKAFQAYYQQQIFTRNKKVIHIDNGTEIHEDFEKQKDKEFIRSLGLDLSIPIAIYIARVVPLKGQKELIQKYQKLSHQLIIVGPNDNANYFADCLKLKTPKIHLLGAREDINKLIDIADYYISHSFHEGLPISIIEAASRKCPCLLYDIPGHAQFNKISESVVLFNDENFEKKVKEVLEKEKTLSENFFKLVENNYSSKSMHEKILKLYKELISC